MQKRLEALMSWVDNLPPKQAMGLGLGLSGLGFGALTLPPVWRLAGGAAMLGLGAFQASKAGWVGALPDEPVDLLKMVKLAGGSFLMGASDEDGEASSLEKPQFEAQIEGPLWVQQYPMTNTEYRSFKPEHALDEAGDLPVTDISWFDAIAFCNHISEEAGFQAAYTIDGVDVAWDPKASGYRLPTEMEWEYFCRASTTTRYSFGDDAEQLGDYAWFWKNSSDKKHPIAQKKPNPWDLYDIHGNVWEWCWGAGLPSYPLLPDKTTTIDKSTDNDTYRPLRGGSFDFMARNLRSSDRNRNRPRNQNRDLGFRCVRVRGHEQGTRAAG